MPNSSILISSQQQQLSQKTQLWKINDKKAQKSGLCKSIYSIQIAHQQPDDTSLPRIPSPTKSTSKWKTSYVYNGEWLHNKRHGYGTKIWSNGNKYEGEWKEDKRDGYGTLWINDNDNNKTSTSLSTNTKSTSSTSAFDKLRRVYSGSWHKDKQHGAGVQFYPNGSRYEGEFVDNLRHGRGQLTKVNGERYFGDWHQDKQTGWGTLIEGNGNVYEGEWCEGEREGQGLYYWIHKNKVYDGEWMNNRPKCGIICKADEVFAKPSANSSATATATLSKDVTEEEKMSINSTENNAKINVNNESSLPEQQSSSGVRHDRRLTPVAAQIFAMVNARMEAEMNLEDMASSSDNPDRSSGKSSRVSSASQRPFPVLDILNPDLILAQAMQITQMQRAAIRSLPLSSLQDLYPPMSLNIFHQTFTKIIEENRGKYKVGCVALYTAENLDFERLPRENWLEFTQSSLQLRPDVRQEEVDEIWNEMNKHNEGEEINPSESRIYSTENQIVRLCWCLEQKRWSMLRTVELETEHRDALKQYTASEQKEVILNFE